MSNGAEQANPHPARGSKELDKALADSFPASDPPARNQPTQTGPIQPLPERTSAYVILPAAMAEKPLGEWKTCGQARWLSPNIPALMLALSPALALLDALAAHGMRPEEDWVMARLEFEPVWMHRLDSPHEGWRQRAYREEVRADGDRWAVEHSSLLLRVPSALCPMDHNLLINRAHPDLERLSLCEHCPVTADPRLSQA